VFKNSQILCERILQFAFLLHGIHAKDMQHLRINSLIRQPTTIICDKFEQIDQCTSCILGLQGGEKGKHLQEWIHCCPRLISRVQEWCYFLALSILCCGLSLVLTFFCIYAPIFVASTLHPQKFVALLKLPTIIKKKKRLIFFKKTCDNYNLISRVLSPNDQKVNEITLHLCNKLGI
jgi:hypothetical protein